MQKEEEELRRLLVEIRVLEGTAESLQSRLNFVNAALTELNLANGTLEGLEKEKTDASLFVPIGGGSYIRTKLESADKVIYGIGAGISIEKTIKEAKEGVSNRISELTKTRLSLEQQLTQVLRRIQEDRSYLQRLTSKLNQEARTSDVRKTSRGT